MENEIVEFCDDEKYSKLNINRILNNYFISSFPQFNRLHSVSVFLKFNYVCTGLQIEVEIAICRATNEQIKNFLSVSILSTQFL